MTRGKLVKRLSLLIGLKQEDLADLVALTKSSIARLESGKNQGRPAVLRLLESELCLPIDSLSSLPRILPNSKDTDPDKKWTAARFRKRLKQMLQPERDDILQIVNKLYGMGTRISVEEFEQLVILLSEE